jgi:hypothetical protein
MQNRRTDEYRISKLYKCPVLELGLIPSLEGRIVRTQLIKRRGGF